MTHVSSLSGFVYIRHTQPQEASQGAENPGASAFMLQLTQAMQSLLGGNNAPAGDIITADPLVADSLSGNGVHAGSGTFELFFARFNETPQETAPASGLQGIFQQIDQLLAGIQQPFQQDDISDTAQKSPFDLQALFDRQRQQHRADPPAVALDELVAPEDATLDAEILSV